MKRRDFIAGGCAVPLVAGAGPLFADDEPVMPPIQEVVHLEKRKTFKDLYYEAQTHINALEEENAELRAHAMIMSKRA